MEASICWSFSRGWEAAHLHQAGSRILFFLILGFIVLGFYEVEEVLPYTMVYHVEGGGVCVVF